MRKNFIAAAIASAITVGVGNEALKSMETSNERFMATAIQAQNAPQQVPDLTPRPIDWSKVECVVSIPRAETPPQP